MRTNTPDTARITGQSDADKARSTIRTLQAQKGSNRAVSAFLLEATGCKINHGLISAIANGKREPSRQLLNALGIRRKNERTPEQKERRRLYEKYRQACWDLGELLANDTKFNILMVGSELEDMNQRQIAVMTLIERVNKTKKEFDEKIINLVPLAKKLTNEARHDTKMIAIGILATRGTFTAEHSPRLVVQINDEIDQQLLLVLQDAFGGAVTGPYPIKTRKRVLQRKVWQLYRPGLHDLLGEMLNVLPPCRLRDQLNAYAQSDVYLNSLEVVKH